MNDSKQLYYNDGPRNSASYILGTDEKYYKKFFYDRRANPNLNLLHHFLHDDFRYGTGVKAITAGLVVSSDFDEKANPLIFTRIQPELYADTLNEKVKIYTHVTVPKYEYDKVTSADELRSLIDIQVRTVIAKSEHRKNYILPYLFGAPINNPPFTTKEKQVLDNVKSKILNIREIQVEKTTDNKFKEIDFITQVRKESYKLLWESETNPMIKVNSLKINTYTPKDQQVLILSKYDHERLLAIRPELYHPAVYQLPEDITTILLPIPTGTAWLFDKQALRIYEYFQELLTDFFSITLETRYVLHEWYLIGFINQFGGCKFVLKNN